MARDRISIAMAIPPGMTAAYGYLAACKALRFDHDEDIELELFYGVEPDATARSLCAGACDVACLNTMVGLVGRDQGLPMIAIGSKARSTHRWFAVVADSPITELAGLRGARIACDFAHLTTLGESALLEEGVRADEITWVPWQGSGTEAGKMVAPLRSGAIDAVFVIDWNDGDFVAEGLPLRHLPSRLLERIRVSSCYWMTEAGLAGKGDAAARAVRAVAKSVVFAFANPQATVDLMWAFAPETRPEPAHKRRGAQRDLAILEACLAPMRVDPSDADPRWGGRSMPAISSPGPRSCCAAGASPDRWKQRAATRRLWSRRSMISMRMWCARKPFLTTAEPADAPSTSRAG